MSKTLTIMDVVTQPPINKNRRSLGVKQALIQPIQGCPNPLAKSNSKRKSQLMESNAFSKSNLKNTVSTTELCEAAKISYAQTTLSRMYLFLVKADWA